MNQYEPKYKPWVYFLMFLVMVGADIGCALYWWKSGDRQLTIALGTLLVVITIAAIATLCTFIDSLKKRK